MKMLRIFIFLLWVLISFSAFSQEFVFNEIRLPNHRNFKHVTGITQDKYGMIWISSMTGLYSYDGFNLVPFKNNPLDNSSIASNSLSSVVADSAGRIWIGTRGSGLDQFISETGKFIHFRHDSADQAGISSDHINTMLVDHNGILWIGTNKGLDRYDQASGNFIHYRHSPEDASSLSFNEVVSIYEDREAVLWVGTGSVYGNEEQEDGGLNRLDRVTGEFTQYKNDPGDPGSIVSNKVSAIFEDSRGTFWVGTAGDGLHTMDRSSGAFTRYPYDPKHPEKLGRPPLNADYARYDHITYICEDARGGIWIGTAESGINYYNPVTDKIIHFESGKANDDAYTARTAWCAFSSRDKILWLGSLAGELYNLNPFYSKIPRVETPESWINALLEDEQGKLWIGTNKGYMWRDPVSGIFQSFVIDHEKGGESDDVFWIKKDDHHRIWLGGLCGLFYWDESSGKLVSYLDDPLFRIVGSDWHIWRIHTDHERNYWFSSPSGIKFLDMQTRSVKEYVFFPGDSGPDNKNMISAFLEDNPGSYWIGCWFGGGLHLLDQKSNTIKHYLDESYITCLFKDSSGDLWVGTDRGLFIYDRSSGSFRLFESIDIQPDMVRVMSIIEDDDKRIWVATPDDIRIIDKERQANYFIGEYFGIERGSFHLNACIKSLDGKIYFGSQDCYYIFDPKMIYTGFNAPSIIFTNFRIEDKAVESGPKGPLKENFLETNHITLKYNQNTFSIGFSVLDYVNPGEINIIYMLEDYNINWVQNNYQKEANFYNIPPGKYTFHVKALNGFGLWGEKKIDIVVLSPWWRSWWAYLSYGLALLAAIFVVDRFQRRRLLRKERERTRMKELEQAREIEKAYHDLKKMQTQLVHAEKMASLGELTAGIAHEIQNPLNFVNNFSEVSIDLIKELDTEINEGNFETVNELKADIGENLEKINFHGRRASSIVKGMLEHSRSGSGSMIPTDLNALAEEYLRLAYHGFRAKDKSFKSDMKAELDPDLPRVSIIPQEIGRVLLNIISNAFFAVSMKGKQAQNGYNPMVVVTTRNLKEKAEIRVKDNGNGISADILDKIFQPFFTTKPAGEGTGLGLSLSYDIITKGHQGDLKVETKEGEGTEFIILLPLKP